MAVHRGEGRNPTVGYPLHVMSYEEDGPVRAYEITNTEVMEVVSA